MNEDKYYKILGLNQNANWEEIKKAFLKIAVVTHPDKGGNVDDFKKANEAYQYFRTKFESREYSTRTSTSSHTDTEYDNEYREKNVLFEKIIHSLSQILA